MDPRLAQRLIGAAVITALAVIFVPELVEQRKPPVVANANTTSPPTPDAPQHVETPALNFSDPQPALAAPPVADSTPTTPAIPITATPIPPESPPPAAPIGSDVQRVIVTPTPDEPTPTAMVKSTPDKVIPLKAAPETQAERRATAKATYRTAPAPHRTGTVEPTPPPPITRNTSPKAIAATRHPPLTSGKTPPATPLPTTASVTPKATKPAANPKPRPLASAAKPQTNRRPAKPIPPQPNIAMPTAPTTPVQATPTKPKPESPWDTSSIGFNQK